MKRWLISAAAALAFTGAAFAADAPREYEDATILLVDREAGWIGVSVPSPDGKTESKLTFKVDPLSVTVTNPLNQDIDFAALQAGDVVDVTTESDADGVRRVTEIISYSRYSED